METLRGIICTDLKDFRAKNELAHKVLSNNKGYNSPSYSGEGSILTESGQPIFVEVAKFANELKEAGFIFVDIKKSIIKKEDV